MLIPSWLLDLLGVALIVTAAATGGLLVGTLVAVTLGTLVAGLGCLLLSWRYGRGGDA